MCVVGFHVHFGPDVKEELRSALFPKAPAVSDVSFPLCGIWRLSDRSGLVLVHPHFLSQASLFLLSMHLFVSDSYSLIWEQPPPLDLFSSSRLQSLQYDHEANTQSS